MRDVQFNELLSKWRAIGIKQDEIKEALTEAYLLGKYDLTRRNKKIKEKIGL